MEKRVNLKSKKEGNETITISVSKNKIMKNKQGFVIVHRGSYVNVMNPERVSEWYNTKEYEL